MEIFSKINFLLKKPKIVLVVGQERDFTLKVVKKILGQYFKLNQEIFVLGSEIENIKKFRFFFKNSSLPLLVLKESDQANLKKAEKIIQAMPKNSYLVLNFDKEHDKEEKFDDFDKTTFGLLKGADFYASDINQLDNNVNFKINYKGSTVPIWLEGKFDENQIYAVLAAIAISSVLDLNLVEVSQALKGPHRLEA